MIKTFSILVSLKMSKQRQDGTAPIYFRITVNGKRTEISANRFVLISRWNKEKGCLRGTKDDSLKINRYIDKSKARLYDCEQELIDKGKPVTANNVKNLFKGIGDRDKTLIEIYTIHINYMNELIDKSFSKSTITKYKTSLNHVTDFIKWKCRSTDILLVDLSYSFITEYESFLRGRKNIGVNCSNKYLQQLKKVVNEAVKKGWLDKDPFTYFKIKDIDVAKVFLDSNELEKIRTTTILDKRLETIRDIFLFCCYTGLSYIDIRNLTPDEVVKNMNGTLCINSNRKKTKIAMYIPLMPIAKEIFDKYITQSKYLSENKLFPVLSNHRMNLYLKELAIICHVDKKLTMHMARHTFGTFSITKGIPIESVSKMMGHKSIKTTQIYAKITHAKVENDMKILTDIDSSRKLLAV